MAGASSWVLEYWSSERYGNTQTDCIRTEEDGMENVVWVGQFLGGLGLFFMGLAAFWGVSVYKERG